MSSRKGYSAAGNIVHLLSGSVQYYANLPTPVVDYVDEFWLVQENSGGLLSAFGIYKYPKGVYCPNASNIWEQVPFSVKVSEDSITFLNITNWTQYTAYAIDIHSGDKLVYNDITYKNLTGTQTGTAPDTDITNWEIAGVMGSNPVGLSYLEGKDTVENSVRFSINPATTFARIQKIISSIWQPASLEIGANSLWLGVVGIAGLGHHLATESKDGHLHFHAHSEFDGELTIDDVAVLYADYYAPYMPVQPDESEEWTGTSFDYLHHTTSHALLKTLFIKIGAITPTAALRLQVWKGIDENGVLAFDQVYPMSDFAANTEVGLDLVGKLEFDDDKDYLFRYSSEETFSLKTDTTGVQPTLAIGFSRVREDRLLQTKQYVDGDTFKKRQLLITDRQIYVCNTAGVQTGTFENNEDKWDALSKTPIMSKNTQTTGLISGGILTRPTYVTLSWTAGNGYVTRYTNPNNPDVIEVSWDAVASYTPVNLGNPGQYLLAYDETGTLSELPVVEFDAEAGRRHIVIGGFSTISGIIARISASSITLGYDGFFSFKDFLRDVIGPANIDGNIISANGANLTLYNSGGLVYILGSNFRNDSEITDERAVTLESGFYFSRVLREAAPSTKITADGSGIVNVIDPTKYDDGSGTLQTISGNRYSVQVVYITPDGEYVVAFGQETYNTESLAEEAVLSGALPYEEYPLLQRFVRRAYLVVKSSETDLNNSIFIPEGKFRVSGVSAGGGVKIHSSLTGLEWDVAGHLFENGGILDIGDYDFKTQGKVVIQDNLITTQSDGIYAGKIKHSVNNWKSVPVLNKWEAKDSVRPWVNVAVSSDAKYVTAVTIMDKIYTSDDYGETFTARETDREWRKVAMSSDGQYQTAVVFNGQIYTSFDYGVNWTAQDSVRNWFSIGMSSTGQYQTAGINNNGIYVSSDYGDNWSLVSKTGNMKDVAMSSTGQYQAVAASGEGVYVSSDYGATFAKRATVWGWVGVDMSADGQYMTAVAVTPNGRIYRSTNYGVAWAQVDDGIARDYAGVSMSDDGQYQTAVEQESGQVFVSVNYGNYWAAQNNSKDWTGIALSSGGEIQVGVADSDYIFIYHTNFMTMTQSIGVGDWRQVAISADGKYQTAIAAAVNKEIYTSSDYGKTFIQSATSGSRSWYGIAMSSDGKYQTATVIYGDIYISSDYGITWIGVSAGGLAWTNVAMSGDGQFQVAITGGEGAGEYIYISYDYGATWSQKGESSTWQRVACSSDGRYITVTDLGNNLYGSEDYGETWSRKSISSSWHGVAMSSDGKYQTAVEDNVTKKIYVSSDYGASFSQKGMVGAYVGAAMSANGKYQLVTCETYKSGGGEYSIHISDDYGQTWIILYDTRMGSWIDIKMSSDGKFIIAANDGGIYTYCFDSIIHGNVNIVDGALSIADLTTEAIPFIGLDGKLTEDPTNLFYDSYQYLHTPGLAVAGEDAIHKIRHGLSLTANTEVDFNIVQISTPTKSSFFKYDSTEDEFSMDKLLEVPTLKANLIEFEGVDRELSGLSKLYFEGSGTDYMSWDTSDDIFSFTTGMWVNGEIWCSALSADFITISNADITDYVETPILKHPDSGLITVQNDLDIEGTLDATAVKVNGTDVLTAETDPVFLASPASGILAQDIINWDEAYGWGDHAAVGYLTEETDPIFSAWDKSSGIVIAGSQLTGFAAGGVAYESGFGGLTYDNLFNWDNSLKRLGVNKVNPTSTVDVAGTVKATGMKVNGVDVLTVETDPIFTAWDKAIADLTGDGPLQFLSATGRKINLYSDTYAIGVESGELKIASNDAIIFYTDGYAAGTEIARMETGGMLKVLNGVRAPQFWSTGLLKIQPDIQGDVEVFGDTRVDNNENSKIFKIWRQAQEGNDYIRFYISASRKAFIHASNELILQAQQPFTINSVTEDIFFKVGDNAGVKKFYFQDSDNADLVTIDSNGLTYFAGNIGIGVSPSSGINLDVAASNPIIRLGSTKNGEWTVGERLSSLEFYGSDGSTPGPGVKAEISMLSKTTYGNNFDMAFQIADTAGVLTEVMKILQNGNVEMYGNLLVQGPDGFDSASEAARIDIGDVNNYIEVIYGDTMDIGAIHGIRLLDGGTLVAEFYDTVIELKENTNISGKLTVDQSNASGAIPVLTLDQADVSEPWIEFLGGTISTGKNGQNQYLKVNIQGMTRYLRLFN